MSAKIVPSPEGHLGFKVGTDRRLADWPAIVEYFRKVAAASDRVRVEDLGETTEGNPFILATVSSPENLRSLDKIRENQSRLNNPAGVTPEEAERLVKEGKTVVLITCSIHSTEVGGSQMSMELLHSLASGDDPGVKEVLDNVVLLLVPSLNPDGNRMVVDWYNRHLNTPYEGTSPPYVYHKYAGHDNNRDWFMFTLKETRMTVEKIHNVWHPQIVYDIHQMGQKGPRLYVPPFIDPIEPNVDPVLQSGVNFMGISMADALAVEGKRGVTVGWEFDGWTPARAYQHYHGGIRILSEAASVDIASPITIKAEELKGERGFKPLESRWTHPMPWRGGRWTLRDIVDYEFTAARACLRNAARYRERWLRGSLEIGRRALSPEGGPYAFLVPPAQRDPGAVYEMLEVLRLADVEVHEASEPFTADGVEYPAGTRVILVAQPFGRFARTMLERQVYPDLRENPGDAPKVPYDVTAHTLGFAMGVEVVQVREAFKADLRQVKATTRPVGAIRGEGEAFYMFPAELNASAKAANLLLAKGFRVFRTCDWERAHEREFKPGAFVVEEGKGLAKALKEASRLGVDFFGVDDLPEAAFEVLKPRVGVYRAWMPNADEAWLRMVLEEYGFDYVSLTPQEVRQDRLSEHIDVLIFPDLSRDAIVEGMKGMREASPERYEPMYRIGLGEEGNKEVLRFLEEGGCVVTLNHACSYPLRDLQAPAENPLEGLKEQELYIPGSILRVNVDETHPLGFGFDREASVMFLTSPAFKVKEGYAVAKYPESNPLLSGWILGEKLLHGLAAAAELPAGRGMIVLLGFPPHFRNQYRSTFKMLFNAIYYGASGA